MTYEVRQLEVFEFEMRRAVDHYELEAPQMLDAFFEELDATIDRIARAQVTQCHRQRSLHGKDGQLGNERPHVAEWRERGS